jgi:hypothetical protein
MKLVALMRELVEEPEVLTERMSVDHLHRQPSAASASELNYQRGFHKTDLGARHLPSSFAWNHWYQVKFVNTYLSS